MNKQWRSQGITIDRFPEISEFRLELIRNVKFINCFDLFTVYVEAISTPH